MKVMVMVNGNEAANDKVAASDKEKMFAAMGKYNEELEKSRARPHAKESHARSKAR